MHIIADGHELPFPLTTLQGRLRLCGVPDREVLDIIDKLNASKMQFSEDELFRETQDLLSGEPARSFRMMHEYDEIRKDGSAAPLIIVLEGASATGKSMLTIDLIHSVSATRIITTDTVRQVLRSMLSEKEHPEVFCHTYQAHKHKQAGPESLSPILRGYLAQYAHIQPIVLSLVQKTLREGADTIVEGVHMVPGVIHEKEPQVIEVVVNPDLETHRRMFLTKYSIAKLRSVSADESIREEEFAATREIQDFMLQKAKEKGITILQLIDYDQGLKKLHSIILAYVRELLDVISVL